MGLFSLPFFVIHHIVTYLYPLYASYKAIVANNGPSRTGMVKTITGEEKTELAELQGWLMYWSVVGTMSIVEGWGEWAWSCLIKVIFTLWLVLPQTKGSTYLYVNYLGPFLQSHEDDIDIALESARQKAGKAAGQWLAQAWEHLRSTILGAAVAGTGNNTSNANPTPEIPPSQAGPTHPPPTMHDPLAGSANQLLGLVKRYGPMAAAGVVSAMDRAAHAAGGGTSHPNAIPNDQSLTDSTRPTSAAAKRKANLEAQLNERSRQASDSDDREPWSSSASASASDTEVASTTASSRVSKIRKAERDLGGSYQLVDDEGQKTNVDQASSTSIAASPSRGGGWTAWLRGSASPAQAPSTSPS